MTCDEAIDWLYGTQLFGIKLGLDAVRRLLDQLDVPVERIAGRQIVHVAGTNGKGSVCAMVESMSRHAGRRTALFTSPHLIEFSERIRVGGEAISKADIARLLSGIRERVGDWDPHPTFFEITLAMAAKYFSEREADVWILETGMGGRLDATNVFESDVAVLTPIALDHQQWLGDSLAEIAAEKAGIIKSGARVISAAQPDEALAVIQNAAPDVDVIDGEVAAGWTLGLAGAHQRRNAALAVAVAAAIIGADDEEPIRAGLDAARWPGRFEVLDKGRLILDGAHNPAAARALVATWREQFGERARATIILGAAGTKDIDGVLRELAEITGKFVFVPIRSQRGLSPDELVARLDGRNPATTAQSLDEALAQTASGDRVLVTGSLFLVGEMLSLRRSGATIRETEQ